MCNPIPRSFFAVKTTFSIKSPSIRFLKDPTENYCMQSSLNFSRKIRLTADLLPNLAYLIV